MYNLPYFKEKNPHVIRQFLKENPFAFIIGCNSNLEAVATQIPVFLEEEKGKEYLRGHIMKQTDHHKTFLENNKVLVVFTGKHTYVSATLYSDPHQASTWNYMSVHVKGKIRFLNDDALEEVLRKTTLYFENNNKDSTTIFDNLSDDYKRSLMKAIVAFEIEITEINNVFKLSQDRDKSSYKNIIGHLSSGNDDSKKISEEMDKRKEELFRGEQSNK